MVFNKKGFTLIELITVIAIIAIISGGLIYLSPKFITKQRLKNDAWQVLNDIKEVQERARAQLERLKIEFDLN
jgi:prepilin-type N-terminal cleavage/methylation domain-containing protein